MLCRPGLLALKPVDGLQAGFDGFVAQTSGAEGSCDRYERAVLLAVRDPAARQRLQWPRPSALSQPFMKPLQVVRTTDEGAAAAAAVIGPIARAEGLPFHAAAAERLLERA